MVTESNFIQEPCHDIASDQRPSSSRLRISNPISFKPHIDFFILHQLRCNFDPFSVGFE